MNASDTLLPNWLTRCAENAPGHLAVRCGAMQWSFAALDQRANRLARYLSTAGIGEGCRVALLAINGLPYVTMVHALARLGAILVPLNTRLTFEELRWQIDDVHASHLLCDTFFERIATDLAQAIPALVQGTLQREFPSNDIILQGFDENLTTPLHPLIDLCATQAIMYTSGTTGKPKGVIITYGMQWWNAIGSALNLGHHDDDCWLACLPLFHIGGLSILLRSVIYGISVIVHEKFDAATINTAIYRDHVTIISVVTVMLERMLTTLDDSPCHGRYPSTLRCILLGGGPAPRSLLENCATRAIPVVQTYGLTEACSQAVTLSPADALHKIGSAGRPLPQVQLRIMNEDRPTATGEPGTIYLKGPSITPGYADRPHATAQAIHEGWLSTGDVGYLDEEGYLYVLDRRSDLIISGGENIYPAEIEAVLLSHPDVAEAGVCGQTDAQWGQVPVAFVCLHTGHAISSEALLTHATQRLARYKIPKTIYIVDHLPRNASGKLLRHELLVELHAVD